MDIVATIRRIGFKRWYERQLLEGHGWLVTVFLALIAVASCIEAVSFKDGLPQALLTSAFAVGCVALGIHAWQRYFVTMTRAEALGEQSHCPSCRAYGKFQVETSGLQRERQAGDDAARYQPLGGAWMRVRCRKCSRDWTIE
jgi:putative component of membrane protein insertase Oxa1/YidC/SpoIIIJ protein YidD